MVKELLVNETLTDTMIKSGSELITKLDELNADVHSAFWFYISEENTWRLILVSEKVSTDGPRKYYKRIMDANNQLEASEYKISLSDMEVSTLENNLAQLLRVIIKTDDSINGIRFSKNTINGYFIDDVYIYRIQ